MTLDRPVVRAQIAVGGSAVLDPSAGAFVLGVSRLGQATLTSVAYIGLDAHGDLVRSVTTEPGQNGPLDGPAPSRFTITAENWSGAWDPDNPASPYYGQIDIGMPVRVVADLVTSTADSNPAFPATDRYPSTTDYPAAAEGGAETSVRYGIISGYVDDIVPDYGNDPTVTFTCSDTLSSLGRVKLRRYPVQWAGERTGDRLARIFAEAQFPPSRVAFDDGLHTCTATGLGDWALPLAEQVVETELGELWVDGEGVAHFYDRTRIYIAPRSTAVQATFGYDSIRMTGLEASRRRGEVFNEARITRSDDGAVEQVATSTLSINRYGPQTYSGSAGTLLADDTQAASLTSWIVARYKTARTDFSHLTVDATTAGRWGELLSLRRFDRIRAVQDYGPRMVDVELLVESIAHDISPDGWEITFGTRNTEGFTPFRLGFSKLGTGVLA